MGVRPDDLIAIEVRSGGCWNDRFFAILIHEHLAQQQEAFYQPGNLMATLAVKFPSWHGRHNPSVVHGNAGECSRQAGVGVASG